MTKVAFLSGLFCFTACIASSQTSDRNIEQALIDLDKEWNEIRQRRDVTALDSLLADDFIHTDEKGQVTTKVQRLANFRARIGSVERSTHDDYRVRVYENTALMTHSTTYADGRQERSTHVFVKRQGRWQAVAHHSSLITQP